MLWAVLLRSEYRRVKKAVLELARTNPVVLAALVAAAAGVTALGVRSADFFAAFSLVPGGLSGLTVVLLLFGSMMGFTLALTLPREEYFDEQFRLTKVSPMDISIGLRGIPLLLAAGASGVPAAAMMWRLYALVGVSAHGAWTAVFAILYLAAAIQGAALAEALRGYRSWMLFAAATLSLSGALAGSVILSFPAQDTWYWIATYLPSASIDSDGFAVTLQPAYAAAIGAAGSVVLSVAAWTAYSLRPDRPRRRRRIEFSAPIGAGILGAFPAWAALTIVRQRQSRNLLALTMLTGVGAAALLSRAPSSGTASILVTLTASMVLLQAAVVVLTFSEDRSAGSWLVGTIPASAASIGLAWWAAASSLTAAIGGLALAPSIIWFSTDGVAMFLTLMIVIYASVAAVVGRILPWSRESPARQFIATAAVMAGAAIVYYAYYTVSQFAVQIEDSLGTNIPALPMAALLLLAACASSVAVEWMKS